MNSKTQPNVSGYLDFYYRNGNITLVFQKLMALVFQGADTPQKSQLAPFFQLISLPFSSQPLSLATSPKGTQMDINPTPKKPLSETLPIHSKYILNVTDIQSDTRTEDILYSFAKFAKYPLIIVANWHQSKRGQKLKARYEEYEHIFLIETSQVKKADLFSYLLQHAFVYIHGSGADTKRHLLVEAVSSRLPIIALDEKGNREDTANKAIYYKNHVEVISHIESMNTRQALILSQQVSQADNKVVA